MKIYNCMIHWQEVIIDGAVERILDCLHLSCHVDPHIRHFRTLNNGMQDSFFILLASWTVRCAKDTVICDFVLDGQGSSATLPSKMIWKITIKLSWRGRQLSIESPFTRSFLTSHTTSWHTDLRINTFCS